jgi:hypothetical protein
MEFEVDGITFKIAYGCSEINKLSEDEIEYRIDRIIDFLSEFGITVESIRETEDSWLFLEMCLNMYDMLSFIYTKANESSIEYKKELYSMSFESLIEYTNESELKTNQSKKTLLYSFLKLSVLYIYIISLDFIL